MGSLSERDAVNRFFNSIDGGSIDKLILEHSNNALVIPINFPWSDIGSWYALDEYLRGNAEENLSRGEVISIDSTGCMVYNGDKTVALVGVEDLVVVESEDSILILNKHRSQDVKKVIDEIDKSKK